MRLFALALFILMALSGSVAAGSYTIVTTPEQDEAIDYHLQHQTQPANRRLNSPQEMIEGIVRPHLRSLVNGHRESTLGATIKDWDLKTPSERAAACAALGVKGCPRGK